MRRLFAPAVRARCPRPRRPPFTVAPIFISYRRSDAKAWAIGVRDALAEDCGPEAVFLDHDDLQPGAWNDQLALAVAACSLLVVVIGPQWLAAADAGGRRRLDDPEDVHRRELAQALVQPGTVVLPLLVDGAAMPAAAELPAPLQALARCQALRWSDRADHRAADRARLLAAVRSATGLGAPAAPPRRGLAARGLGPALAGTAVAWALAAWFRHLQAPLDAAEWLVLWLLCVAAAALLRAGLGWLQQRRRALRPVAAAVDAAVDARADAGGPR